ncbi:MAG: GAF domain-containing sensor histidine kinase [Chloroflexi bacterium]|nr:GAF domain-containing sensor histidine kinase [Chloroflexota bacterium]
MNDEQINKLADTCEAWLQGDWRELHAPDAATVEESRLFELLSEVREQLITASATENDFGARYVQLEDQLHRAEALLEAAKILTSTLDLDVLLKTTTEKIAELFKLSDGAEIFLYDPARDALVTMTSFGYPVLEREILFSPGEGAPGLVFQLRQPLLADTEEAVAQLYESVRGDAKDVLDKFKTSHPLPSQSVLCVPFITRDKVIGSLQLEHWTDRRKFKQKDLRLLTHLADLIAIAVDNGMLWKELGKKEDRLRQMFGQLINVQEAERKRIATEIHDGAGQALTLISIGLTNLADIVPPESIEAHTRITDLRNAIRDIMGSLRDLTFTLYPSVLDDLGLVAALKWYTSRFVEPQSPKIILTLEDIGKELNPTVATVLYRVAQEALTNSLRHSQATEIRVSLSKARGDLVLTIEDDGNGFNAVKLMQSPVESFGLYGMSERLALVNGSLKIRSSPGQGTFVRARVPLYLNEKTENA